MPSRTRTNPFLYGGKYAAMGDDACFGSARVQQRMKKKVARGPYHPPPTQNIYNDAVCSAAVGWHVYPLALQPHPVSFPEATTAWLDLHIPLCSLEPTPRLDYPYPPRWRPIAGVASETPLTLSLALPNANDTWVATTRVDPYSGYTPTGRFVRPLDKWMNAGPRNTWVERDAGASGVTELAMAAPLWLFSRWPEEGMRGGYMGG